MLFYTSNARYSYTIVSMGLPKNCDKEFMTRDSANQYMYNICGKYNLKIVEIYDDKHYKTYICNNGARFFISRV